jgi:hypothetical protein
MPIQVWDLSYYNLVQHSLDFWPHFLYGGASGCQTVLPYTATNSLNERGDGTYNLGVSELHRMSQVPTRIVDDISKRVTAQWREQSFA